MKPNEIRKIYILGPNHWRYEFDTIDDAVAGLWAIADEICDVPNATHRIEAMVEFTSMESERCAYDDKTRVVGWLERFR